MNVNTPSNENNSSPTIKRRCTFNNQSHHNNFESTFNATIQYSWGIFIGDIKPYSNPSIIQEDLWGKSICRFFDYWINNSSRGSFTDTDLLNLIDYIDKTTTRNYLYIPCLKDDCSFLVPQEIKSSDPWEKILLPLKCYKANHANGYFNNQWLLPGLITLIVGIFYKKSQITPWRCDISFIIQCLMCCPPNEVDRAFVYAIRQISDLNHSPINSVEVEVC